MYFDHIAFAKKALNACFIKDWITFFGGSGGFLLDCCSSVGGQAPVLVSHTRSYILSLDVPGSIFYVLFDLVQPWNCSDQVPGHCHLQTHVPCCRRLLCVLLFHDQPVPFRLAISGGQFFQRSPALQTAHVERPAKISWTTWWINTNHWNLHLCHTDWFHHYFRFS